MKVSNRFQMGTKLLKLLLFEKTLLNLKDSLKKCSLRNDILNESDLKKVHNYPTNRRDSKRYSYKVFVNLDNGTQGDTHWMCIYIKDKKSF